jgi:Putative sensor
MVRRSQRPDHVAMTKLISVSRVAGRDLAYLLVILALGVLDCVAWMAGVSVTATLLVAVVGIPVWLVTVAVFRYQARLSRRAAGWIRRAPIRAAYTEVTDEGLLVRARVLTTDPQTWRDLGWLVLNSTVGVVLASVAIGVTGLAIGYILTPAYYWALHHPSQQYATLNLGLYTVRSVGWAFVTTGLGLVLLPLALWLNHATAVGHARLAERILSPVRAPRPDSADEQAIIATSHA